MAKCPFGHHEPETFSEHSWSLPATQKQQGSCSMQGTAVSFYNYCGHYRGWIPEYIQRIVASRTTGRCHSKRRALAGAKITNSAVPSWIHDERHLQHAEAQHSAVVRTVGLSPTPKARYARCKSPHKMGVWQGVNWEIELE